MFSLQNDMIDFDLDSELEHLQNLIKKDERFTISHEHDHFGNEESLYNYSNNQDPKNLLLVSFGHNTEGTSILARIWNVEGDLLYYASIDSWYKFYEFASKFIMPINVLEDIIIYSLYKREYQVVHTSNGLTFFSLEQSTISESSLKELMIIKVKKSDSEIMIHNDKLGLAVFMTMSDINLLQNYFNKI